MAYIWVFGGITLFTLVFTWVMLKSRQAGDALALSLRSRDIVAECGDLLVRPDFVWSVWQDTDKAASMKQLIRNSNDELLATVTAPTVVLDGVLKRFVFTNKQYEIYKPSLMTSRTCLREVGTRSVLMSAIHATLKTTYCRSDSEQELCTIPAVSVFQRAGPVTSGSTEIGKQIVGLKRYSYVRILSLYDQRLTVLEQIFLLASK